MHRNDREIRGGGVLLAVSQSLPSTLVTSPPDLEVVAVQVGSIKALLFCIVYIPPNAPQWYCQNLVQYLTYLSSTMSYILQE